MYWTQSLPIANFKTIWPILENLSRKAEHLNLTFAKCHRGPIFSFYGTMKDLKVWIDNLGCFQWSMWD